MYGICQGGEEALGPPPWLSDGSDHSEASPPSEVEVGFDDLAAAPAPEEVVIAAPKEGAPQSKGVVEGLHARFLLDEFLAMATVAQRRLEEQREVAVAALRDAAAFVCAPLRSAPPAKQLAVLGVLREFSLSLAKCHEENIERDAAESAAADAHAPSPRRKSTGGTQVAAAPAKMIGDPDLGEVSSTASMASSDAFTDVPSVNASAQPSPLPYRCGDYF